jgi:hypothetical protein
VKALLTCLALLFCGSLVVVAQTQPDSVHQRTNALGEKINVDSLTRLPQLPDSLLPSYKKVDSIRNDFNEQAGKIKNEYDSTLTDIESEKAKLTGAIDSLQKLNLPTDSYTKKLDSLNQKQLATTSQFNSKMTELKSKTTGKLDALDLPPQYKEPVQALTKNIDGLSLDGKDIGVPGLEIPGYSLPEIGVLPNADLSNLNVNNLGALPKIETPVGDLGEVGSQLKGVQDDVKSIAGGDLNDAKNIPKAIEDQAGKVEGVAELQKQSGVMDDYKGKLEAIKNPDSAKNMAIDMAKEKAIDHFAGKEEQLKAAMQQMSKYKQKYSSVSSIKDLPKRKPNAMKGKPFVERLIPGLYFQYQQKTFNLFDFNPYLGYRISGIFTAGAGWNQRFAYDRRKHEWNHSRGRIYGPRAYVDGKVGKGFSGHIEGEAMNSFVPSVLAGTVLDQGRREWVWSVMTGIKKEYKIYKNLRGTVLIQYNLFNPKYKAPYVDRLNSRIGFEYALKKKKKKEKK